MSHLSDHHILVDCPSLPYFDYKDSRSNPTISEGQGNQSGEIIWSNNKPTATLSLSH
jgi:hypothetical protein